MAQQFPHGDSMPLPVCSKMEHHHATRFSSPTSDHSNQGNQDNQPQFHPSILTSAQRYVDLPDCEVTGFAFRAAKTHQGQVRGSYIQTFSTCKAVQVQKSDDQDSAILKIQVEDATAQLTIIQSKLNEPEVTDKQAAAEHRADLKARLKLVYDQEYRGTLLLVCRIRPPIGDELSQLQALGQPWTGISERAAQDGGGGHRQTSPLLLQYNYNPARLQLALPASIPSHQQPTVNSKLRDKATLSQVQLNSSPQAETTTSKTTTAKTFLHNVFVGPTEDTDPIWDKTIGPLVKDTLLQGGRTTILAYGCTGSGKTYTMNWIGQEVAKTLFGSEFEQRFSISATCVEIYKENMYDLLVVDDSSSRKKTPKKMQESGYGGQSNGSGRNNNSKTPKVRPPLGAAVLPTDATSVTLHSHEELTKILSRVAAVRAAAATAKNPTSSRSHAIFTLRVTTTVSTNMTTSVSEGNNHTTKDAYITLTDLAGFEREWEGKPADNSVEAHAINKGLLSLGRVLKSLAKQGSQSQKVHIPYRDHLLTMVLSPLMEQSRVCLLLTASPMSADAEATLSTLEFGKSVSVLCFCVFWLFCTGKPFRLSVCLLVQAPIS